MRETYDKIGDSILYLDDCFDVMQFMRNDSVDVTFTSPPYNRKRNDKYTNYDDTIKDYFGFLVRSIDEMRRVTKGNVYVNLQKNYYNKVDIFRLFGHYAEELYEVFVWEKSNPMPANNYSVTNAYEFILAFGDKCKANHNYTKNHLTTSVVTNRLQSHKAVMHPALADFFVKNFTQPGDRVFDPFMGSGTTGVSCIKNGRKFTGVEIDEEYYNIAKERISPDIALQSTKKE
jgi:site-specific DNA-methyltransferase (adenine-specific)